MEDFQLQTCYWFDVRLPIEEYLIRSLLRHLYQDPFIGEVVHAQLKSTIPF